jgi:hypothetical protein
MFPVIVERPLLVAQGIPGRQRRGLTTLAAPGSFRGHQATNDSIQSAHCDQNVSARQDGHNQPAIRCLRS